MNFKKDAYIQNGMGQDISGITFKYFNKSLLKNVISYTLLD